MNPFSESGIQLGTVLVGILIGIVVPIWVALKAEPLATFPYRWATYWAAESIVIAVAISWQVTPTVINRGIDAGLFLLLLLACLSLFAAVGLFARMKAGAVFLIASEVLIILLPFLMGTFYGYTKPHSPSQSFDEACYALAALVLISVNVIYFKKRWSSMGSALRPRA